jgi:hypothetical protein
MAKIVLVHPSLFWSIQMFHFGSKRIPITALFWGDNNESYVIIQATKVLNPELVHIATKGA